jgi:hypothetical protein
MSMTDHAPAAVHNFQTCADAACGEMICAYYRAGLAAGAEFIRCRARASARFRALVRGADGEVLEPES